LRPGAWRAPGRPADAADAADAGEVAGTRWAPTTAGAAWTLLTRVCWGLALVGCVLALGNTTALFAVYHQAVADAWFRGSRDPDALTWMRFTYGIIGATFAGHFVMLALALRCARGQRWVLQATATSMLAWFAVDATGSALHGAWFNVWLVDAPSLLAVLAPCALAWRATAER
jgi:hypothetical protein